jgi:hypothetical protein
MCNDAATARCSVPTTARLQGKIHLLSTEKEFDESENKGFFVLGGGRIKLRLDEVSTIRLGANAIDPDIEKIINAVIWTTARICLIRSESRIGRPKRILNQSSRGRFMAMLTVNGQPIAVDQNQKSSRSCGTPCCSPREKRLLGGRLRNLHGAHRRKPTKACVQQTDRLDGKSIVTVEGLSARERDVYAYAFSSCGAVQCGFCTPGMVITPKG